MSFIHIDVETSSTSDLKKVGAAKYFEDPNTVITCFTYKKSGYSPWTYDYLSLDRIPLALETCLNNGYKIKAFNAQFEYYALKWLHENKPAWPEIPWESFVCTMAQAAYNGLPLSLESAGNAIPNLPHRKNVAGAAVMKRMARPRKIDKATGEITWWHETDAQKFQTLLDYNADDVLAEEAIGNVLPPLPSPEQRIWQLDARANDRGMYLDKNLVHVLKEFSQREQDRLSRELDILTNGELTSPNQVSKIAEYVGERLYPTLRTGNISLAKDAIPEHIARAKAAKWPTLVRVLEIRQEAAKTSVAKLDSMLSWASNTDHRMRGLVQYYGAFRTGRWAGRGPQIQNFPRSKVKDQDALIEYFLSGGDPEGMYPLFGCTPLEGVSSALRGCVSCAPGNMFASLDYSQIEARVLAWMAGEAWALDAFRQGKDLYRVQAAQMFGIPEDQVTQAQRDGPGKVSILACGYQGAVGAFQTMASTYGFIIPDEEADKIVKAYRAANKNIVNFWYRANDAAVAAVNNPGKIYSAGPLEFYVENTPTGTHLKMRLPSGRKLTYRDAQLEDGMYGPVVSYMGQDQYTRKWVRIWTYGGKLVENAVQAFSRDILATALVNIDQYLSDRVWVLGSVHDEGLFELPGDTSFGFEPDFEKTFQEINHIMQIVPAYAKGLPIKAAGYLGYRFKKG